METLATHYSRLLGTDDSWRVESVDLQLEDRRVEIRLKHVGSGVTCPECGLADHADERCWPHLDTMQFTTELLARLPRCPWPERRVQTLVPPWAGKHSRFTLLFEAFAIEVLQACRNVKAAAAILGLAWDSLQTIMNQVVERGLERGEAAPIPHLGIDEKSFRRGHDYRTVLTDLDGYRVLDVVQDRTQVAAEAVLETLTPEQRQQVRAVAADMLPAYANAAAKQTPNAELVHDKFHVAKHLGEAVDQVRRAENKAVQAEDDDRLKGTRQLWLFKKAKLSWKQRRRFAAICRDGLKTACAWAIKGEFRWFWRHVYSTSAEEFFNRRYAWGATCRLRPVVRVSKMLERHVPNLLSYFLYRITNATSEGFNIVIQALTYAARGFRSFKDYRMRIRFFCGKLDPKPQLQCHQKSQRTKAHLLCEEFQRFWAYASPAWAGKFLESWCTQALRSRLAPMKNVVKSLQGHRPLNLNWFLALGAISASIVEGFNGNAKLTTRKVYGFRTPEGIEIALLHVIANLPEPESTHRFC